MRNTILVIAIGLGACKETPIAQPGKGSGGGKTASGSGPAPGGNGDQDAVGAKVGLGALDSKYAVNVNVMGINFCTGTASFVVNIPAAPKAGVTPKSPFDVKCLALSCAFGKQINVDSLLAGLSSGKTSDAPKAEIDIDEKFFRLKSIGTATFSPALIMIPNVTGADPKFLGSMNETAQIAMKDAASGTATNGTQVAKTMAFDSTWTDSPMKGINFDKVFHFSVTNSGFNGAEKVKNAIFSSLEARLNLSPVALLSIAITLKVADLLPMLGTESPPSASECGTPPAPPQGDAAGVLAKILGGVLSGAGTGSGSDSGEASGSDSSILGKLGGLTSILGALINIRLDAVLIEQKGLKEASERQDQIDSLRNSQTSGAGS